MLAILRTTFLRPARRFGAAALGASLLAAGPLAKPGEAAAQTRPDPSAVEPVLPVSSAALLPDTVLKPRGGPELIRLVAPGSALTALRLSIPIDEAPAEAGGAQILVAIGLDRARAAAAQTGARVDGARTPWGIAYTVVGPTEDFDYLTYVLREAVAEPRLDRTVVERTKVRVREEAQRERETASGRLAARLRAAAVPGTLPLLGTLASLDGLDADALSTLWERTHRRDRMSLVIVGPETLEMVLAALGPMGADGGAANAAAPLAPVTRPAADPAPKAEVLRSWYGNAWAAGDATQPESAVVAALISRRLRERPAGFESEVALWDVGDTRVLAVTGASYNAGLAAMRRRVDGLLSEATRAVTREELAPALASLRLDILSGARTPWGLATTVGRYRDATGDPEAAYLHLTRLDDITPESIKAYAARLDARGRQRAEVRP